MYLSKRRENSYVRVFAQFAVWLLARPNYISLTPSRKMATAAFARARMWCAWIAVKEFGYNWKEMRVGEPVLSRTPATAATESFSPANR